MVGRDVIDLSRIIKRLPFFEEASPKRDTDSWWKVLKTKALNWGIEVRGIVSDRAKVLVKLGESDYLDAFSMPDLFHFIQEISKVCGLQLGRKRAQAPNYAIKS